MADNNYDVWLPNQRGNFYSRSNINPNMNPDEASSGFWDFSWDDIGLKDYPAIFKYIQTATKQPEFFVIAHSQGASSMMALLSEKPEFNDQIRALSLMAPVGYLNHAPLLIDLGTDTLNLAVNIQFWGASINGSTILFSFI